MGILGWRQWWRCSGHSIARLPRGDLVRGSSGSSGEGLGRLLGIQLARFMPLTLPSRAVRAIEIIQAPFVGALMCRRGLAGLAFWLDGQRRRRWGHEGRHDANQKVTALWK